LVALRPPLRPQPQTPRGRPRAHTAPKTASTTAPPPEYPATVRRVSALAYSPDGAKLATATADGVVCLFDDRGKRRDRFKTKPASKEAGRDLHRATGLAWSPDAQRLAISQTDGIVFVYHLGIGWEDKKAIKHKFEVRGDGDDGSSLHLFLSLSLSLSLSLVFIPPNPFPSAPSPSPRWLEARPRASQPRASPGPRLETVPGFSLDVRMGPCEWEVRRRGGRRRSTRHRRPGLLCRCARRPTGPMGGRQAMLTGRLWWRALCPQGRPPPWDRAGRGPPSASRRTIAPPQPSLTPATSVQRGPTEVSVSTMHGRGGRPRGSSAPSRLSGTMRRLTSREEASSRRQQLLVGTRSSWRGGTLFAPSPTKEPTVGGHGP